jgi:hypothetical protein
MTARVKRSLLAMCDSLMLVGLTAVLSGWGGSGSVAKTGAKRRSDSRTTAAASASRTTTTALHWADIPEERRQLDGLGNLVP